MMTSLARLTLLIAISTPSFIVRAAEPDWPTIPITPHAVLQAVDASGSSTHPLDSPVRMRGVILNDPALMLDGTAGAPAFLGGQWQIYVQSADAGDFGGTACYMAQLYGNMPFNPPDESYSDAEWLAELDRLNHDFDTAHPFAVGDLVEIHARAPGLFFRGKANINEQHGRDPELDFDLVLLEADRGLPTPALLTLADLKDAADAFIFDASRATGCERYQGELVRLNDVWLTSTNGWAPDGTAEITDATGRTFPLKLSRGDGFNLYDPPAGAFDLVAIMDQEDATSGGIAGYRLWVTTDYDGNGWIVGGPSGDFDSSGAVTADDYAYFADCLTGPDATPAPAVATVQACRAAFDFDMDRDVDLDDYAQLQTVLSLP